MCELLWQTYIVINKVILVIYLIYDLSMIKKTIVIEGAYLSIFHDKNIKNSMDFMTITFS